MAAVTVVGLGNMGSAVARTFAEAGHEVTAWNRTAKHIPDLERIRVRVVGTLAAALRSSPLIVLVLSDHAATRSALEEEEVATALAGRTVVQLASVRPAESSSLADWLASRDASYLGGSIRAYPQEVGTDAAELGVAGPTAVFEQHSTTLRALGSVRYVGNVVARAAALNVAQAALMECFVAAFHEVLAYALSVGVQPSDMLDALPQTVRVARRTMADTVRNMSLDALGKVAATQAALRVHEAGLALLAEEIKSAGGRTDVVSGALAGLQHAVAEGLGECEISAVMAVHDAHRRSVTA